MPATVSQVVKQFQQDWTRQFAPEAIRSACRDLDSQWRQRLLDPVVTIQLFFVQILHGNTACTHLRHLAKVAVTASAYCQARMKLPLRVFQRLLRGLSERLQHAPLDEGRWLGHRTFWVDGSSFSMPDTPALHPTDVLVGDRGFCSSVHIALLVPGGVHAVFRVHQKHIVDFTPSRPHVSPAQGRRQGNQGKPRSRWVARLGACDQRVEWLKPLDCPDWMDAAPFAQLPNSLQVRE